MKTFLLIFIFALSLKADTIYDSKCVKKFTVEYTTPNNAKYIRITYYNDTQSLITYTDSLLNQLINNIDKFTYSNFYNFANGFTYNLCTPISKDNTLGMTNEQYTFMMALTGLLSSILLVSIIFKKV